MVLIYDDTLCKMIENVADVRHFLINLLDMYTHDTSHLSNGKYHRFHDALHLTHNT